MDVSQTKNWQIKVQKFGGFLSSMVMPNIGAFIAWGIITALFIPTGWIPNEFLNRLVGPTLTYLLPILIGYTGGYNIHGKRGGVAGAIATMGVVIGASVTMLIGGMIMGPLAGWIMKKVDKWLEGKCKPGFEMLIDNFSLGIIGGILMILGLWAIEPIFNVILTSLSLGVNWVLDRGLIPLASIFVAPAQVLFLNNAINHGIMAPLGVQQVAEYGKSILFLVEGNGGPLVGVMLAYCIFGRGIAKKTAPAASVIVMFGGIAEVYFPYILMKPILVLAPIFGSMTSLFIFQTFGGGTVAVPSPGSIFAFLMMTPKGSFIVNIAGYFGGMLVSFLIAGFLLKIDKSEPDDEILIKETTVSDMNVNNTLNEMGDISSGTVKKILVACDAGMGSSAMGASLLKSKIKKAMLDISVTNASLNNIPNDADLIITHKDLLERAKSIVKNPNTQFIGISNFLEAKEYDKIIDILKK